MIRDATEVAYCIPSHAEQYLYLCLVQGFQGFGLSIVRIRYLVLQMFVVLFVFV